MTAREKVAEALYRRATRGATPHPFGKLADWVRESWLRQADAAIAAHLDALAEEGKVVVQLPEPVSGWWDVYEEDGDDPDHNAYGDGSGDFHVTTWSDHPGEVQISHQGEPLEPISPMDARTLAAALLAAAEAAEAAEAQP